MKTDKIDLSLVPISELLREVESRCITFVACRTEKYTSDKDMIVSTFGRGRWDNACSLASILNNGVLNDWNGEMRTIQKIIEREED